MQKVVFQYFGYIHIDTAVKFTPYKEEGKIFPEIQTTFLGFNLYVSPAIF